MDLHTPAEGLKEFFERSSIWVDLCNVMDEWIDSVRDQLENPSLELSHRELDRLGGITEALRRVKEIQCYIFIKGDENNE